MTGSTLTTLNRSVVPDLRADKLPVVTRDVPAHTVVAGVPAKVLRPTGFGDSSA